MEKVVSDTIKIFENIPLRDSVDDPTELPEALTVIVVNYDGVNPASLVTGAPSPNSADLALKKVEYLDQELLKTFEGSFVRDNTLDRTLMSFHAFHDLTKSIYFH